MVTYMYDDGAYYYNEDYDDDVISIEGSNYVIYINENLSSLKANAQVTAMPSCQWKVTTYLTYIKPHIDQITFLVP